MPHSGGGGSSGGGSHGGGGGSGGRSSIPSYRVRNRYFRGARSYVYYRSGRAYYVYSDTDLRAQPQAGWKRYLPAAFLLIFVVVFAFAVRSTFVDPSKLNPGYDYPIEIVDGAAALGDTTDLNAELTAFKEKTGITPAVLTVYNDTWSGHRTLEDYAYDLYVDTWNDETHFLIVYSVPSDPDSASRNWRWETMIGDETDPILSESRMEEFNDLFDLNRRAADNAGDAFTETFRTFNETVMENSNTTSDRALMIAVEALLVGLFVYMLVSAIRSREKFTHGELTEFTCEGGVPETGVCHFCGGEYVMGTAAKCPHCGADIQTNKFGI